MIPLGSGSEILFIDKQPTVPELRNGKTYSAGADIELQSLLQSTSIGLSNTTTLYLIDSPSTSVESVLTYNSKSKTVTKGVLFDQVAERLSLIVNKIKPKVIVPLCNEALFMLTERWGLHLWRGSIIESTLPTLDRVYKIIPTYSVKTYLPPEYNHANKFIISVDLRKIKTQSAFPEVTPLNLNCITAPSFQEAMAFLETCETKGLAGEVIDCDIEVIQDFVSCIGFAHTETDAISIPFVHTERGKSGRQNYFDPEQEILIWKKIDSLLTNPAIWKRGQNFVFDSTFLARQMRILPVTYHDTMVAQNTLYPDYPKRLDFMQSIYTNIPYHKDEGKRWFKEGKGTWQQLWRYNCIDVLVTAQVFPRQKKDLIQMDNWETYMRQRNICEPLVAMSVRGILCDVQGMAAEHHRLQEELTQHVDELNEYGQKAGLSELNPNSPKQLKNYFYVIKNLPPYKNKGRITTDDTAMKRLIRKGFKEADLILKIRKIKKLLGTYLPLTETNWPAKVDPDKRIRCSYSPAGTRYSRLSSSENIFGTGSNLQNWPHLMLKYLVADPGHIMYSFDLSQFENRIVAYVGKIDQMMNAFEQGVDVHRLTAGLVFGKDPSEVSDEAGSSPLGDGKSERDWGKRTNHGLNYDFGYKSFALMYHIPEKQAKWIVEKYHQTYPGVRNTFHENIRRDLYSTRTITNLYGRRTMFLGKLDDATFKEAYSCIPQGTCGDKINEDGLAFIYYNTHPLMQHVQLLNQVHDSIVFQIPTSIGFSNHAAIIEMIRDSMERPMTTDWGRSFSVPVDLTIGLNGYKGDSVELKKKNWPASQEDLATKLEEIYEKLQQEA